MDWKSLPAFLAVARHGSLRAAAEHMGGTHATLRRQVEALEAQLGTQLFRRGTDGLSLTAAGRRLLPQALEAEAALLKGFNAVQGLDREAAGMTFLATWVTSVFPELQRVPGTELDQRRATWVLLHGDLRRVRRVRLFVDYLCNALQERRAAFVGS